MTDAVSDAGTPEIFRLYAPIAGLIFFVAGAAAFFFYRRTREFWIQVLNISRGGRIAYYVIAVGLFPLILGAWADLLDITHVTEGKLTHAGGWMLCGLALLGVVYVMVHVCWFDREESLNIERTIESAKFRELNCQKNYLIRLLENLRVGIGVYEKSLASVSEGTEQECLDGIDKVSPKRHTREVIETVRRAYKDIETVPRDRNVSVALFRRNVDCFEHAESYDGSKWDSYASDFQRHRQHFNIDNATTNVVVSAGVTRSIFIVEDTDKADADRGHPFNFFSEDEQSQRDRMGSLVAIPLEVSKDETFVLSIVCPAKNAFLNDHRWKADQVKDDLEARLRLLSRQEQVLRMIGRARDLLKGKLTELESKAAVFDAAVGDFNDQVDKLKREVDQSHAEVDRLLGENHAAEEEKSQLMKALQATSEELAAAKVEISKKIDELAESEMRINQDAATSPEIDEAGNGAAAKRRKPRGGKGNE